MTMELTPRKLLYAMLDEMTDEDIKELCRIIGNLKLSEELTIAALTEAAARESDLSDILCMYKRGESSQ